MLIDIALSLLLVLIQVRLAYLGVRITMQPLAHGDKKGKDRIKIEFWVLAIAASGLVAVQGFRNGLAMQLISKSREATIRETKTIPAPYSRVVKAGSPLTFNVFYQASNDVSKVKSAHVVFVVRGSPTHQQEQDMYSVARSLSRKVNLTEDGVDQAQGIPWHITTSTERPLLPEEQAGILTQQYVVYIVGFTQWQNPSGSSNSTLLCEWLNPDGQEIIPSDAPWHACRGR